MYPLGTGCDKPNSHTQTMKVNVLGAGSWGTALSILLARNQHEVTLIGREDEDMRSMQALRENLRYLPGFPLPEGVTVAATSDQLPEPDLWVMAVPSGAVREISKLVIGENSTVVIASKGIEAGSRKLLCEVIREVIPTANIGILSGPNLAKEVVQGIPTVAVLGMKDLALADKIRYAFMSSTYRVYTSTDVVGIELAGALKNVLAIGAGMSDALGFGDNTKGAFLARGIHEMALLGLKMGAKIDTFLGIAGVGDLFATAVSNLSRNYRVGYAIGRGATLEAALEEVGQVAEGISTSESVMALSRMHQISMPTFEAVETVIRGRVAPRTAVQLMMERLPRAEEILPLS